MPRIRPGSAIVLVVSLLVFLPPLLGQEKVSALGTYDFYHYFEYQELTRFLTDIHEAFGIGSSDHDSEGPDRPHQRKFGERDRLLCSEEERSIRRGCLVCVSHRPEGTE